MPKKGRPKGSKNRRLPHAHAETTRCPACGSTRRAKYVNRNEHEFAGTDSDGRPYTHVVKRRTSCLDCGQHRIDRHFENRPSRPKRKK